MIARSISSIVAMLICALALPADLLAQSCVMPPPSKKANVNSINFLVDSSFPGPIAWPSTSFNVHGCIASGVGVWHGKKGIVVTEGGSPLNLAVVASGSLPIMAGFFYPTTYDGSGALTGGVIEIPENIDILAKYDLSNDARACSRVKKIAAHETGHLLGMSDFLKNSGISSTMTQGDDYNIGPSIDALPEEPTPCDVEGITAARQFHNPGNVPIVWGQIGGPGQCDVGMWSDEHGCCHGTPSLFVASLGHNSFRPASHAWSPPANANYLSTSTIPFRVHTMDLDGRVVRLDWEYKKNGGAWTALTDPQYLRPFSVDAALTPGSYEIRAVAYDTADLYAISESRFINVAPPPTAASVLASGQALMVNQYRTSANGQYLLVYQVDGNLVLYGPPSFTTPIVWTGAFGPAYGALMNSSGNVELYNTTPTLVWQSGTGGGGNAGSYLWVTDTGKIALVRPNGSIVVQWP